MKFRRQVPPFRRDLLSPSSGRNPRQFKCYGLFVVSVTTPLVAQRLLRRVMRQIGSSELTGPEGKRS